MSDQTLYAQINTLYKKESFVSRGDTLLYRVLYPENFEMGRAYPLIVFLHGSGERGKDNEAQLTHGSDLFLEPDVRQNFPSIVLFPQCPRNDYWAKRKKVLKEPFNEYLFYPDSAPGKAMSLVMELINAMMQQPFIDTDRIYIGGLSMGGMGTFEIVHRMPKAFAAAFPICGGGDPSSASKYAGKLPFWIFHGEDDKVVNPEYSKIMAEAIRKNGGQAKLTLYPGVGHNSWDSAFTEPELLPWIFSHTNKNR